MGRIFSIGGELGHIVAEGASPTLSSNLGQWTINSTIKRSGVGSHSVNAGASNLITHATFTIPTTSTGQTFFGRAYIYIPSSSGMPLTDAGVMSFLDIGNGIRGRITLLSTGVLRLQYQDTGNVFQTVGDSSVLSTDTWYRVDLAVRTNTGATDEFYARLDNTQFASITNANSSDSAIGSFRLGFSTAAGANKVLLFDDVAVNDTTSIAQTSYPPDSSIVALLPISDVSRAALWTGGAGGTTNLFEAVNNVPPIGTATETDLTQIEHAGGAAGSTDAAIFNLQTYTSVGIVAADTINVVQSIFTHGEDISTGTKLVLARMESNPVTGQPAAVSAGNDAGSLGTFPTFWYATIGLPAYAPTVTLGTSPQIRVQRNETASRVASVAQLAALVDYSPATAVQHTGTLAMDAAGAMTFAATQAAVGALAFNAVSNMTMLGGKGYTGSFAFAAATDTTFTGIRIRNATLPLDAVSSLTVVGGTLKSTTLPLSASTDLTLASIRNLSGTLPLSATGTLALSAVSSLVGSIAFDAVTIATLAGTRIRTASIPLDAASDMTLLSAVLRTGVLTLSAAADATFAIVRNRSGTLALDAASALAVSGNTSAVGALTLSATSDTTIFAQRVREAVIAFVASSDLTLTALRVRNASLDFAGLSDFSLAVVVEHAGTSASLDMSASSDMTFFANATYATALSLFANTGATIGGGAVRSGVLSLDAVSNVLLVPSVLKVGFLDLSAVSDFQLVPTRILMASAAFDASTGLTLLGGTEKSSTMPLSASTGLLLVGERTRAVELALSAQSDLSLDALRERFGTLDLSAVTTLSLLGGVEATGLLSLSAESGFVIEPFVLVFIPSVDYFFVTREQQKWYVDLGSPRMILRGGLPFFVRVDRQDVDNP